MTHTARLHATLGLGAALSLALLSACAQTPHASTPGASPAARPSASAPAPTGTPGTSRAAAYTGHFESDCQQLGEAFYTRDLVDLSPNGQGGLSARYAKAFHDADGCAPASLIVVFHMPAARWTFDGTTQVQGRTVDRIQTSAATPGDLLLTASQARPGWLDETPTQFLLKRDGKGKGLPIDKAVAQPPGKELRLLTSQRLYSSTPDDNAEAYPTALELESYLHRKPPP